MIVHACTNGENILLCKKLEEIEKKICSPTYLLQNREFPFFDTTHSKETHNTISLINLNSIKDLSKKLNAEIEYERFRGNIYIENIDAWKEREWIGKTITINDVQFTVDSHIPRCSATNLKPNTDINTINLPLEIKKIYNHSDMGAYLKPKENGLIQKNMAKERKHGLMDIFIKANLRIASGVDKAHYFFQMVPRMSENGPMDL